jgi:hypothetical protein
MEELGYNVTETCDFNCTPFDMATGNCLEFLKARKEKVMRSAIVNTSLSYLVKMPDTRSASTLDLLRINVHNFTIRKWTVHT